MLRFVDSCRIRGVVRTSRLTVHGAGVRSSIGMVVKTSALAGASFSRSYSMEDAMNTVEDKNSALVLEAFETLFNKRDYAAAEKLWSANYIQHSAHIPPGREGLFALVKAAPANFRYENALVVAQGDYVLLHGRFSNIGQPAAWIVVDIVRMEDGRLAEHWDVIQDEATRAQSKSGNPMFGKTFPA